MNWTSILHGVAATTGVLGLLAIICAWLAGEGGTILGRSQTHLYNDANVLLLASIAFGIGVLIHRGK